jgi:hypothetical protein
MRARVAPGESPHIGVLRTMFSAQRAYQSANRGFYDHPRCLVDPSRCVPDYPPGAPVFLDRTFLDEVRYGYRFTFHPGPTAAAEAVGAGSGLRGYCIDASDRICFTTDGVAPQVVAGACVTGDRCRILN